MCEDNQTQVNEFRLLGFQGLYNFKIQLFALFLLVYIAIMGGNLLIILLVTISDHLNSPMFYFVKHLALADVLLTTNIVPFMLHVIIMEQKVISLTGCIIHLYSFGVSGFVQCFLLAVMSYDRYLAIRKPLRYTIIMDPKTCLHLVTGSWFIVFALISSEIIIVCQLHFCANSYIDHFFCDFGPVVGLSTSDTSALMLLDMIISFTMIFTPFAFIIITYILICFTIFKIPSATGRTKFFSTCGSHLTTVGTYYVTLILVYMVPAGEDSFNVNKFRSLLYVVVTPLMNPIIYSLRNQEIQGALRKIIRKYKVINQKQ
ncbi:olfactory receptor 5G29-like [Pelodytes ibericus]